MKVAVKQRDIKLAAGGTVAWASQVLDLTTRSGSDSVSIPGMRVTTVLEKRRGAKGAAGDEITVPVTSPPALDRLGRVRTARGLRGLCRK